MKKTINTATEILKNEICDSINKSGLPPVLVSYILKEFIAQSEMAYKNQLEHDMQEDEENADNED